MTIHQAERAACVVIAAIGSSEVALIGYGVHSGLLEVRGWLDGAMVLYVAGVVGTFSAYLIRCAIHPPSDP